jgi:HK97 family phage portal protein
MVSINWPWSKKSAVNLSPEEVWRELLSRANSKSGIHINSRTILQLTTAQACARVIAEDIAQLPFKLYKDRQDSGSDPAIDHPLYKLLKTKPNDWQTSFELREQIALHLVLTNNAYIWLNRTRGGIYEMLPLEPQQVQATRNTGWITTYKVTLLGGSFLEIPKADIWHIRGPSWNGWSGLDGVRLMREAVGMALALEEHGNRMFSNGATVGGVLSTDQQLKPEQVQQLRESWEAKQSGSANAYKTAVMWGGMKWNPMASNNDAAQWVETRRFQVEEVCRAFKVMPIMVGHSDKTSTYASAEQMFLAHLRNTMGPWLTRVESSADCNLLTDQELSAGYHVKFQRNAYLASVSTDRAAFYKTMHDIGAFNANEIRSYEDLNPYDGGDTYLIPLNMVDANAPATPPPAPPAGDGNANTAP